MQTNDDDNSETQEDSKSNATSPNATIEETDPTDDEVGNVTDGPDKSMEWESGTAEHDMGDASVSPGTGSKDRDLGHGRQMCVAPNQEFLSGILYTLFVMIVFMTIVLIISTATTTSTPAVNNLGHLNYDFSNRLEKVLGVFSVLLSDMSTITWLGFRCYVTILLSPFLVFTPTLSEVHWETSVIIGELTDVPSEGWTIPLGATIVNIEYVPRSDTTDRVQYESIPYYYFTVKEWHELPPLMLHGTDQTPRVEYASYSKSETIRFERSAERFWGWLSNGATYPIPDETHFKETCTLVGRFVTYPDLKVLPELRCTLT